MEGIDVKFNVKEVRKLAFAVGFGLTVGKAVGDLVSVLINDATTGSIQCMAKHGNKVAQKACEKSGIDYQDESIGNGQ